MRGLEGMLGGRDRAEGGEGEGVRQLVRKAGEGRRDWSGQWVRRHVGKEAACYEKKGAVGVWAENNLPGWWVEVGGG